jgi:hypothetical protein
MNERGGATRLALRYQTCQLLGMKNQESQVSTDEAVYICFPRSSIADVDMILNIKHGSAPHRGPGDVNVA